MHRVDTDTAQVDKFGAGKNGFTGGTPPLVPPTIPGHEIFDALQEEIANAIELAGIALMKGTNTQLHAAIVAIRNACFPVSSTANAAARFDGITGKLLKNGVVLIEDDGDITGTKDITLSGEVKRAPGKSCEVLHRGIEINGYGWGERPVAAFAGVVLPSCNQDSSYGNLRLHIPQGATITEVRVFVNPGASRATPANRMQISLSRIASISTSGVAGGALDSGFAAATDSGTNVSQQVTLTGSHVHRAGDALYVTIVSGNTAAASPDALYGVLAFYTENEIGGAQ